MSALRLLNHMTTLHTDSHVWAMRYAHTHENIVCQNDVVRYPIITLLTVTC